MKSPGTKIVAEILNNFYSQLSFKSSLRFFTLQIEMTSALKTDKTDNHQNSVDYQSSISSPSPWRFLRGASNTFSGEKIS